MPSFPLEENLINLCININYNNNTTQQETEYDSLSFLQMALSGNYHWRKIFVSSVFYAVTPHCYLKLKNGFELYDINMLCVDRLPLHHFPLSLQSTV